MQQKPNITLFPYYSDDPKIATTFLRILVAPLKKEASITQEGLLIPGDVGVICETGVICAICEGSTMKVGDTVLYKKLDRTPTGHIDTMAINGVTYDVLFENEVWAVNNHPFNLVFVKDISEMQVNEGGLLIPTNAKGITAKGKVFRAPSHYSVKSGDDIEYRKQERDIYPTILIDRERYLVMHEADIFLVNGKVASYRVIVKIDIAAQRIKRSTTENGLVRSPLFIGMLHNLQVGEVMEIGEGAHENFPELKVGDQAIMHHRIENEPHRLVGRQFAKADPNVVIYEYRALECFDVNNRDLLGRVVNRKKGIYAAFGKNIFLDWKFEVLNKIDHSKDSLLLEDSTAIEKCTDIDDFRTTIKHKQQEGFDKAVAKRKGILNVLKECKLPQDTEKYDRMETQLRQSEKEILRLGNYINANHLLVCTRLNSTEKLVVTYKELYPINVLGRKMLVGYDEFVEAQVDYSFVTGTEAVI